MDEETENKLKQLPITITIDNDVLKTNAWDVFFLFKGIDIYTRHDKLKNFLKRVMDKELEKVK